MLTVETKLARWRAFYGELCEAEQRLRQASQRCGSAKPVQLELEVRDLKQRCDEALDQVGAALAARRSPHADGGSASSWHAT